MNEDVNRGRPRDDRVESAVTEATLDLLAEVGYARLSIEQVSARAGIGKSTIYRRWRSKAELVLSTMVGEYRILAPPDTGTLRGDLTAFVKVMIARLSAPGTSWALPGLIGDLSGDVDLAEQFSATVLARQRNAISELMDRAVSRGELSDRPDLEYVHATLLGTIFGWLFLLRAPLPADLSDQLGTQVANALLDAAPVPPPIPLALRRGHRGRPPTGPGR